MEFFEKLGVAISGFADQIISYLPKSPIVYLTANPTVKHYLGYINWFIPIYSMIGLLEGWLLCIFVYYALQWILRWAKLIE